MGQLIRFGRRIPLPSSVGILHELLNAQRDADARGIDGGRSILPKTDPEAAPPKLEIVAPPQG
jgi:hypothetical protein